LLQKHLCVGDFALCKAGMLDVRKQQLFVADSLPIQAETIVASEMAWLDGFFKMHSTASQSAKAS
jgi:hypothetical protein